MNRRKGIAMPNPNRNQHGNQNSNDTLGSGENQSTIKQTTIQVQSQVQHGLDVANSQIKRAAEEVTTAIGKDFRAGLQEELINKIELGTAQEQAKQLKEFIRDDIGAVANVLYGKSKEANQKRLASCESEIIDAVVIEDDWSEFEKPIEIPAFDKRNSPLAGLLGGKTDKAIKPAVLSIKMTWAIKLIGIVLVSYQTKK